MELMLSDALLVIDVQNDFCPNGALPVVEGDLIVQPINAAMDDFDIVVLTLSLIHISEPTRQEAIW